eukprot:CAMPEP_0117854668 /NCGR_PEP_ID=MMETSP0950-20121206/154_1 /TAXON_ID=44440 /ORGANISM="Chattonella subsalsa, Strain CCMP2191" /LENGTH=56 /DNA_ID=CAMNT_0005703353 /DNA_START=130 /DNA_END=300 /DNA_ORIENTATION=-
MMVAMAKAAVATQSIPMHIVIFSFMPSAALSLLYFDASATSAILPIFGVDKNREVV